MQIHDAATANDIRHPFSPAIAIEVYIKVELAVAIFTKKALHIHADYIFVHNTQGEIPLVNPGSTSVKRQLHQPLPVSPHAVILEVHPKTV